MYYFFLTPLETNLTVLLRHSRKLNHPNVVAFHGACLYPVLAEVKELCGRGSIYDILNNPREKISWDFVVKVAEECLKGLTYLHSQDPPIPHRNLRSSNLLVSSPHRESITFVIS